MPLEQSSRVESSRVEKQLAFVGHCTETRELCREGPSDLCVGENCLNNEVCGTSIVEDAKKSGVCL